ncbi:MAG: transposase [Saprospirales bacterium]|nr:transposase [Saprospirales bacterium]
MLLFLANGNIEIDNNLVENIIRPIAIGRKNYLFAGSHESAQRAAMIYTFFAACKHQGIDRNMAHRCAQPYPRSQGQPTA